MNKNKLLVHEYVIDITKPHLLGQAHYGQWWNEDLEIIKSQYGKYILWYDGQKYFRVGFDNIDWNYIIRTDLRFPTMPQS